MVSSENLAVRLKRFYDIMEKIKQEEYKSNISIAQVEVNKGVRGMPWLSEAKKDVTSCEKLWGGANDLRSADIRMGQPNRKVILNRRQTH